MISFNVERRIGVELIMIMSPVRLFSFNRFCRDIVTNVNHIRVKAAWQVQSIVVNCKPKS